MSLARPITAAAQVGAAARCSTWSCTTRALDDRRRPSRRRRCRARCRAAACAPASTRELSPMSDRAVDARRRAETSTPSPSHTPSPSWKPGDLDAHPAVEDVLVRAAVRLERADVLPVAVDHVAVQRAGRRSSTAGNTSPEKSTTSPSGMKSKTLGLEHVDAGVDRVGEHLAPRGLLEEPLDRAVVAGDDDAELDRVLDPLQRDRRRTRRRRGAPSTNAPRSMSVSTSPEITRKVSSSSSIALRTEPAVPSGESSVA